METHRDWEIRGDWRLETGDWRLETGDWRLEIGNREQVVAGSREIFRISPLRK